MTHHLVGMAEIAEMLGVTRQRVAQLIEIYEDFPQPEVEISGGRVWSRTAVETWIASHPARGPGRPEAAKQRQGLFNRSAGVSFDRFTDRARRVVVLAQENARLLNHNYIGTEHLVLGLIHEGSGLAAVTLAALKVPLDDVRAEIVDMIGRGTETPEGHIPFTPRTAKVLELALREALQLGHNYIGTEHLLLGLIREGDGVGWQVLERLGVKKKQARQAVLDRMQGLTGAANPAGPCGTADDGSIACSFCGKAQTVVGAMISGPEVYICNECVEKAATIVAEQNKTGETTDADARLAALERAVAELTERFKPDE